VGTVDLTQQDAIINPGLPANTIVIYYAGMMNYNDGISIDDPTNFTTSQSPQTIIAEVINTETLCESSSFVSFQIFVNELPNLDISPFDGSVVCFDSNGVLIENDVSPPTIDTGLSDALFDFVWTLNGEPLPNDSSSITATLPGTYSVTAINTQTGCEASSSATIIESNPPEFEVTILTPSFSGNHVVEVNNITGSGDFEFQLDDGEWISLAPGQTTLVFSNIAPGMHVIRGRDSGGCGIVEVRFNLIDYPPFFTPNQDGFNDTWNITSLSDQPNAKIYIFDRYGKLLKQLSPTGEGWDGTYNGQNMPAQDYWFRVEFEEPATMSQSTFKAHFTLKR
jgi:gliding motility-associated-like protein